MCERACGRLGRETDDKSRRTRQESPASSRSVKRVETSVTNRAQVTNRERCMRVPVIQRCRSRKQSFLWSTSTLFYISLRTIHKNTTLMPEAGLPKASRAPLPNPFSSGAVASHTAPCLRKSSGPRRGAVGRLACIRTKEGRRIQNARTPAGHCGRVCNASTVSVSALKTRLSAVVDLRP